MINFKSIIAASVAVGALMGAAPAFAESGELTVGQSLTGSLDGAEPVNEDGRGYDTYTLSLSAGQAVEINMASDEFDTLVYLGRGDGDAFEMITLNDDSNGTLNSSLRYTADEAGVYVIRASSFGSGATGSYSLSAGEIIPPTPITLGVPVTGTLSADSPRIPGGDVPYAEYGFTASAGDVLMVTMNSTDFDSLLEIGMDSEWGYQPVSGDDDSGGDLNARAFVSIYEDGQYIVRAMSYDSAGQGTYELTVGPVPQPARPPRPTSIRRGQSISGEVMFGEMMNPSLQFYDSFSLRGRAGETYTVRLQSDDFDAYLEAGAETPLGWAVVTANDDDGESLNSQLDITFEESGVVILRAMALGQAVEGSYTISVE